MAQTSQCSKGCLWDVSLGRVVFLCGKAENGLVEWPVLGCVSSIGADSGLFVKKNLMVHGEFRRDYPWRSVLWTDAQRVSKRIRCELGC